MKAYLILVILVLLVLMVYFFSSKKESYDNEGIIDHSQRLHTDSLSDSSYKQTTNHFPVPSTNIAPIQGNETPFRVNMFNSFMV